jgi:hypothetical protein
VDLWQVSSNVKDGVLFASPQSSAERIDLASTCVVKLAIKMPALVDGIDDSVERAYTGWPDRLYVIGTDGRVKYKSAPGPYGFSTAELERNLKEITKDTESSVVPATEEHVRFDASAGGDRWIASR